MPDEEVERRSLASCPEVSPITKVPIPIITVDTTPPTIALFTIGFMDYEYTND